MTNVAIDCGLSKILKYVEVLLENIRGDFSIFLENLLRHFLHSLFGLESPTPHANSIATAEIPIKMHNMPPSHNFHAIIFSILGQAIISVTAVTAAGSHFVNSLYAPRRSPSCLGIDGRYKHSTHLDLNSLSIL